MKKIIILLFITILLIGCENVKNTPTNKVEDFLGNYQRLDRVVLDDLKKVMDKNTTMSDKEKEEYTTLLEKQYQNLSYKITKEEVTDNAATVDVEIEVLDYKTSLNKSNKYYEEHKDEFTEEEYIEYKLKELKTVSDTIKYEITFNLIKEDGIWKMENLTDSDIEKIHGLY